MINYEDLPDWVFQIVSELEQYEDQHAKREVCLKSTLEKIPSEVRSLAKGWLICERWYPTKVNKE